MFYWLEPWPFPGGLRAQANEEGEDLGSVRRQEALFIASTTYNSDALAMVAKLSPWRREVSMRTWVKVGTWVVEKTVVPMLVSVGSALAVMTLAGVFHLKGDVEKVKEASAGVDAKVTTSAQEVRADVRKSLDRVTASVNAQFADLSKQVANIHQNVSGKSNRVASNVGSGSVSQGDINIHPTPDLRRVPAEAPILRRRIAEGQALLRRFQTCMRESTEWENAKLALNQWIAGTHEDLKDVGVAGDSFERHDRQLLSLSYGTGEEKCLNDGIAQPLVEMYINNLYRIMEDLTAHPQP